jgi:hypothetical protein
MGNASAPALMISMRISRFQPEIPLSKLYVVHLRACDSLTKIKPTNAQYLVFIQFYCNFSSTCFGISSAILKGNYIGYIKLFFYSFKTHILVHTENGFM